MAVYCGTFITLCNVWHFYMFRMYHHRSGVQIRKYWKDIYVFILSFAGIFSFVKYFLFSVSL